MPDKSVMLRQTRRCCIPIEVATLIFGILSAVLSCFCIIIFVIVRTWYGDLIGDEDYKMWLRDPDSIRASTDHRKLMIFVADVVYMLMFFLVSLVSFTFSVFLCYGTKKRRPCFVKAYLVYGVAVLVLLLAWAMLSFTGILVQTNFFEGNIDGLIILIFCVVYSLILLMVNGTYEVIRDEQSPNQIP